MDLNRLDFDTLCSETFNEEQSIRRARNSLIRTEVRRLRLEKRKSYRLVWVSKTWMEMKMGEFLRAGKAFSVRHIC
jgi:hypothetical protein